MKHLRYYTDSDKEIFMSCLDKIKSFGYDIYLSKSEIYLSAYIVSKGGIVSHISPYEYGGVRITTKHHNRVDCGGGFVVAQMITANDITIDMIEESFADRPRRFRFGADYIGVRKVSLEDLRKKHPDFDKDYEIF